MSLITDKIEAVTPSLSSSERQWMCKCVCIQSHTYKVCVYILYTVNCNLQTVCICMCMCMCMYVHVYVYMYTVYMYVYVYVKFILSINNPYYPTPAVQKMFGNTTLGWSLPINQHGWPPPIYLKKIWKIIFVGGEKVIWF